MRGPTCVSAGPFAQDATGAAALEDSRLRVSEGSSVPCPQDLPITGDPGLSER